MKWMLEWQFTRLLLGTCMRLYAHKLAFVCGQKNGSSADKCCTFSNLFTQPKMTHNDDQCVWSQMICCRCSSVCRNIFLRVFHCFLHLSRSLTERWCVWVYFFITIVWIRHGMLYKWAAKLREMIIKWCVDKSLCVCVCQCYLMFSHFYTTHKINIHTL